MGLEAAHKQLQVFSCTQAHKQLLQAFTFEKKMFSGYNTYNYILLHKQSSKHTHIFSKQYTQQNNSRDAEDVYVQLYTKTSQNCN